MMSSHEYEIKMQRVQQLIERAGVDALHLTQNASIAWLSGGGRSFVDIASDRGVASLLVKGEQCYVLTNNIEAARLRDEEHALDRFEMLIDRWYQPATQLSSLTDGLRLAADGPGAEVDLSAELVALRAPLTEPEVERYRALGRDAGAALATAARQVRPGMTEFQIAGLIARATYAIGAVPVVTLVGADQRLHTVRHPLPTEHELRQAAMLVLCARRDGLIANLTRLVHVGPVEADLQRRLQAVARIDAETIAATQPGARVADLFTQLQGRYAAQGFPDEWQHHHQGGACSYAPRDYLATPDSQEVVQSSQAFAWNPSVPGAKSEDTVLVTEQGFEVLTASPDWPMIEVEVGGQSIARSGWLEL